MATATLETKTEEIEKVVTETLETTYIRLELTVDEAMTLKELARCAGLRADKKNRHTDHATSIFRALSQAGVITYMGLNYSIEQI